MSLLSKFYNFSCRSIPIFFCKMPAVKISSLAKDRQFEFRRLTMKNYQKVVDLINSDYAKDHGVNTYGQIDNMNEYDAMRVEMKLQQPWSVGVYDKNLNELLAVIMNTVERRKSLDPTEDDFKQFGFYENFKQRQIDQFYANLQTGVFDTIGVDKVFYLGMMTVRSKYRRNNLSALLIYASHRLAWESGCKYMVACPTTEYLCKAMEKDGWTVLREIAFSKYDAEHKTDLFANAKYPNVKAQLICKKTAFPNSYMPIAKF